jgi:hypothetical protein
MGTYFGTIALWLAVAVFVPPLAGDTTNASPERSNALGVVRLVTMAEADYFHRNGHYATFAELVKSGQLGKTATDAPENLRAFFALNLNSESKPVPGFMFGLDVPAGGNTYNLSLEQKTEKCGFRLLADDKGAVLEGKSEHCGVEEEASSVPENWAPPDIDQAIPTVRGDAPCSLSKVLEETSHRALELSDNLQKFSAKERIDHREFGKNGKVRGPTTGNFNYVAEIHQVDEGTTYIEEYRSGVSGAPESTSPLVDTGTAAFALIFHPRHIDEFAMTCEGLADVGGRPAWLVRFAQRPDRRNDFHAYRVRGQLYRASLKGRAWVAADNYEVVRLEADLMAPIPAIELQKERLVIEYAPVEFHRRDLRLWLPQSATLYVDFHGRRYARTHQFSDFQLFSVDTVEKVKEPALAKDASGQEAPGQEVTGQGAAMGLLPSDSGSHPPIPSSEVPLTPK